MYDAILFPTDGSEGSEAALDHALDLAAHYDARLHVLYVMDTNRDSLTVLGTDVVDALESVGREAVEAAAGRAEDAGVAADTAVVQGDPALTIVDYAEDRGVDAVVMGTHGRRGLGRFLLGSVTERVVRTASVPVLTVRMDAEASGD